MMGRRVVNQATSRLLTILLLVVAVSACFVLALDARPWLRVASRAVACGAFAAALLAFTRGLPRRPDEGLVDEDSARRNGRLAPPARGAR